MWPDAVTAMSLPSSDLFTGLQFPQTLCNASYSFSADKKASCALGNINVTTTSTNTNLVLSPPADGMALTEIFVELQQSGSNFTTAVTSGGPLEVTGTYSIFIKLCVPTDAGARSDMRTVQLLTHGATLDNTYWDMAPGYSYVDAAAMAGYATLSYDRLGTGRSDHPDPLHVVQTPVEVDIIHELVGNLKAITFDGRGLENVVGVGHSLGSAISQGVTTKYPKDFDAVILTGAPANSTCLNAAFASFSYAPAVSDPSGRFSGLSTAYLTLGAIPQASQFAFWRYPHYDKKLFDQQVATKQTSTLGELLTISLVLVPSANYTSPVAVVNGINDAVYCCGDCSYPTNQAQVLIYDFYPNASKSGSQTFLQPDAGHIQAGHHTAQQGFQRMLSFLKDNGL